jgi:hypothetical protein
MNRLIQLKMTTLALIIELVFACFALCPMAQAVVPPPDGGYPGGNTAEGQNALFSLTTGTFNTAVGFLSLRSDTTGGLNTAVGAGTLLANTGDQNTATGIGALLSNSTGFGNTANGALALLNNTTGLVNTASGLSALFTNSTGSNNTAYGEEALESSTGSHNTAVGSSALRELTTGSTNTALGSFAGINVTSAEHVICIGSNGQNVSGSCFIGNIRGVTTANNDAIAVLIDSDGQVGTLNSSRRYKTDIKPVNKASESILALKPVSFRYKAHKKSTPQFGLIAEDVAEVNPDLVIYDRDGEPYSVRYDAVNAMLLNEFLKEHKTVQELKMEIAALTATVKEQAAQIQRVSAQMQLDKASSRTVLTDR